MWPHQYGGRGVVFLRYQGRNEGETVSSERDYDAQPSKEINVATQHVKESDYFHSFATFAGWVVSAFSSFPDDSGQQLDFWGECCGERFAPLMAGSGSARARGSGRAVQQCDLR